jgi:hypothetical protein
VQVAEHFELGDMPTQGDGAILTDFIHELERMLNNGPCHQLNQDRVLIGNKNVHRWFLNQ